ncbi:NAD-binding protein [Cellulomonas cellasea]|uniref:Trk K+ transport system NAD-binding subunit n=1 Tax=Cellulomonas cellasea TaxID=43670 RepID=A0A7W4UBR5_9CELL|nr:NAD-binding protein [Cellulomonas cellasea]MBB2921268.1 Trk K+ transport system NAD-binding subunit [Cellulomonas cellasea]
MTRTDRIQRRDGWLAVDDLVLTTEADDTVLVVGLGTFGRALATALDRTGLPVLGLDHDPDRVATVPDQVATQVADATDPGSLAGAGAGSSAAAVICMPHSFTATILATTHLIELGTQQVWAMAATPGQARILHRLGATPLDPYGDLAAHYVANLLAST